MGKGRNKYTNDNKNTTFICENCGMVAEASDFGTKHRNHCPYCLWSKHVDIRPGDRSNFCQGKMEAISVWKNVDGELRIIHRCLNCGTIKANRVAGDDSEEKIMELAMKIVR